MTEGIQFRAAIFEGTVRHLSEDEALYSYVHGSDILWIDIIAEDLQKADQLLQEQYGFHPLLVEDALSPHERPTLSTDEEDLIFFVVPGVQPVPGSETYIEVAFFVRPNAVVTVSTAKLNTLDRWFDSCARRSHSKHDNVIDIAHALVDVIVDDYYPVLDALNEEIDELEESIYAGRHVEIADSLAIKRRLLEMRRRVGPLRDILNGLLRRDVAIIPADSYVYFQDVYDHALRIIEVIDMERDILSAVMDAHISMQSNRLNRIMQNMTIISTLLMTAAFVAGVYGMNFKFMPELNWPYGYPFAWALMLGLCSFELWIFKKKGWM